MAIAVGGLALIRPEVAAGLARWSEVIFAGAVAAVGLWLIWLGGWLLMPIGAVVLAVGAVLALTGWRRMRFRTSGEAPGVVEVDEGQIAYLAEFGGFISVPEMTELRLISVQGRRMWRLKQSDGQALLIPADARGADALFDAFAALPGMDAQRLIAATPDSVVWTRHLRVLT